MARQILGFLRFVCLFGRQDYQEREIQRSSIHWYNSQMATVARAAPG